MRILIFSAFEPIPSDGFPPLRYAYLAKEFIKRDHQVDFVTSAFFHMHKRRRKKTWHETGNPPGLHLYLIGSAAYKAHTGWRRLFSYYLLALNLKRFLRSIKKENHPDLIITAYPPISANYVLAHWAKRKKIRYVLDLQDVWPYNFEQLLPLKPITRFLLSPLERKFRFAARHAAAIVPVSDDFMRLTAPHAPNTVTQTFHLGADSASFPDVKTAEAGYGAFRLLYIGNASTNNALIPAIEAAGNFFDCHLHLIGLGSAAEKMENVIDSKGFENIRITPWMEPKDLPLEAINSDAALLLVNPESYIAFPYKAYTYWMAGLPVISNIRGGEVEKLIKEYNLGTTIPDDSAETIQMAIAHCSQHFTHEDRERIQQFARKNFDTKKIYGDYCDWIIQHFGGKP
jgi:hypothetical protein